MKTRLIIARHGNTFLADQTPTRVGSRTDLPLVASGLEQGKKIGEYLKQMNLLPDIVYVSALQRTYQTAEQALLAAGFSVDRIIIEPRFNEIDYGPDENKTEAEVVARIGQEAIAKWDAEAIVPEGWQVQPKAIIQDWLDFGDMCLQKHREKTILVITSNGIARFAPYLTGDFAKFSAQYNIKISTGAVCVMEYDDSGWKVSTWNFKP